VISQPLELRRGATVRYLAADSGEWREGTLVKSSSTGEEWLVKNALREVLARREPATTR